MLQLICGNEKDGATFFYAARLFTESPTAQLMLYHADSMQAGCGNLFFPHSLSNLPQAAYARATLLLTPSRTIRWPAGAYVGVDRDQCNSFGDKTSEGQAGQGAWREWPLFSLALRRQAEVGVELGLWRHAAV